MYKKTPEKEDKLHNYFKSLKGLPDIVKVLVVFPSTPLQPYRKGNQVYQQGH